MGVRDRGILIVLGKKQLLDDILLRSNQLADSLKIAEETKPIASEVLKIQDESRLPILARSLSEGWVKVKNVCRANLIMGRDTDDNRLEGIDERRKYAETIAVGTAGAESATRLMKHVPVKMEITCNGMVSVSIQYNHLPEVKRIQKAVIDGSGLIEHTPTTLGETLYLESLSDSDLNVVVTYIYGDYGSYELSLSMPYTFNLGATESIKAASHRIIVNYVMMAYLRDVMPNKSEEYRAQLLLSEDELRSALRARVKWGRHAEDWS